MAQHNVAVKKIIEGEGPLADGRRERSRASRKKIIHAMMDLIAAGNINPSAAMVAEKAGVGLRSVFRHYDDKESIYREIDAILNEAYAPIIIAPYKTDHWKEQLFELVERWAVVNEEVAPFRVSTSIQRFKSPVLMERYRSLLERERAVLDRTLPDFVNSDMHRTRAIRLATSFDTWRHFRQDEELSKQKTVEVIKQLLQDILDQIED